MRRFVFGLSLLLLAGTVQAQGFGCPGVVYLSAGSGGKTAGKWYLTDADNDYSGSAPSILKTTPAETLSGTVTIRATGESATSTSNEITQHVLMVEIIN